jgi:hypothetical protein
MLARCGWCRRPFETEEQPRTQQELGQLKTKLMIPDVAQPIICEDCFYKTMEQPLMKTGNRLLLGY